MSKMIFVNLPVTDLAKSTAFYEAIGFTRNPQFSDETAACMVLSDAIHVMLLTHAKWATFTDKPIPSRTMSEVAFALSFDSRGDVDAVTEAAARTGGTADINPAQDHGFMFSRSFEDPDGHVWEPMWMDMAALPSEMQAEPA